MSCDARARACEYSVTMQQRAGECPAVPERGLVAHTCEDDECLEVPDDIVRQAGGGADDQEGGQAHQQAKDGAVVDRQGRM